MEISFVLSIPLSFLGKKGEHILVCGAADITAHVPDVNLDVFAGHVVVPGYV